MNKKRMFSDTWVMFKRCMLASLRNPEALLGAIITPAGLMWLFGSVFGNIMNVGEYRYVDFIVPGIILQTVVQGAATTAISVNNDMTKGINDRFRSMAISTSAVLTGHVLTSVIRNIMTTALVIGVAIAVGFRPQAGFADWLMITGILILSMMFLAWIAVIFGLVVKTPESAGSMMYILFILPFISSGFAPITSMSSWIKWFAENQPMTPIIDCLRALMLNKPAGDAFPIALIWCVSIIVVAFAAASQAYKRKFK